MEEQGLYILDQLGRHGRQIIGGASLLILYKLGKPLTLGYYALGALICILANMILKILIKQPRPKDDKPDFNFLIQNNKRVSYDKFGMPSGHAQFMFFTLVFMAYAMRGYKYYWWLMTLFTLLTINTVSQRIRDYNHTTIQVVVGSIVGIMFGLGAYYVTKTKLKGKLMAKDDDNALLMV
jgi:membrane-associated phospholipid phosphatase